MKNEIKEIDKEIIKLVSDGFVDKEIACKLHTNTSRVTSRLQALRHRMNAINRANIVKLSYQLGII